jgi:3'-phosphoadenosine 5'-phosphosulfate sulfotransferase (PAPS reductase)/FAD synthetase
LLSPRDEIRSYLDEHGRAVLQFSGGKDSTALLHQARPFLGNILVLFGDTGAVFPHVVDFIHRICREFGAQLEVIRPVEGVKEFTEKQGLPSDIVPIEAMPEMDPFLTEKPKTLVQSYLRCCSKMIYEPMQEAIQQSGVTLVFRGSKKSDRRVGVPSGWIEHGVTYSSPLWEWSDDDVMAYLAENGVSLPAHYETIPDSLDCWICTAHLVHHGAAKMRFIKENYPDLWPEVSRRMRLLDEAISGERAKLAEAFEVSK